MKVTFKKAFLTGELGLPCNAIEDKILAVSRWSIHRQIVFKHEDKFYMTQYSVGATEQQDEGPWEYGSDQVTCVEVKQVERVIKVWEGVN